MLAGRYNGRGLWSAPLRPASALCLEQIADQLGPLDAGPDLDQSIFIVEAQHAIHSIHVDEMSVAGELLAPHCMPAAGDANRYSSSSGVADNGLNRCHRVRSEDPADARAIEPRMDIVDPGS